MLVLQKVLKMVYSSHVFRSVQSFSINIYDDSMRNTLSRSIIASGLTNTPGNNISF